MPEVADEASNSAPFSPVTAQGYGLQCHALNGKTRKTPLRKFKRKLKIARGCARTIGALYKLSWFLALVCFTWTTAVILGAFAQQLDEDSFSDVVFLLFTEAFRLRSMHLLMSIVTRSLFQNSTHDRGTDKIRNKNPVILRALRSKIRRLILVSLYILVQMAVAFPSILQLYFLLHVINYIGDAGQIEMSSGELNLGLAIVIFKALVAVNSVLALVQHALYTLIYGLWHMDLIDQSVLIYFHMVLEDAMINGVSRASDLSILSFAYSALAEELRNGRKVTDMLKRHKKLICCLFYTTIGINSLISFVNDRDPYVQMVALGIAGLWGKQRRQMGTVQVNFELPEAVVRSLIEKIDTGEVGKSAADSVIALSKRPEIARQLLHIRTCEGKILAGRLIRLLEFDHFYILPVLRTLGILYHSLPEDEMQTPPKFYDPLRILNTQLRTLFAQSHCHRVRTCAGYLMQRLGYAIAQNEVNSIEPKLGDPWLETEKMLLQKLRIAVTLSELENADFIIKETVHKTRTSNLLWLSRIGVTIIVLLCYVALNAAALVVISIVYFYSVLIISIIQRLFQNRFLNPKPHP